MRRFLLLLLGLAVMLGLSMTAFAQLVFTNSPGPESSLSNGDGTGIYSGTLNAAQTAFICDDDLNDIGTGDAWTVSTYGLNNVATYTNGMYAIPYAPGYGTPDTASGNSLYHATGDDLGLPEGPTGIQDAYNMAAYLANLLLTGVYTGSGSVNAINWAIWDIMDTPNAYGITDPGGSGCATGYNGLSGLPTTPGCGEQWVTYVGANEQGYSNPNIVIYTPNSAIYSGPDKGGWAQEFFGEQTVPEPLSMILMGTFLSLAGLTLGKKKLF